MIFFKQIIDKTAFTLSWNFSDHSTCRAQETQTFWERDLWIFRQIWIFEKCDKVYSLSLVVWVEWQRWYLERDILIFGQFGYLENVTRFDTCCVSGMKAMVVIPSSAASHVSPLLDMASISKSLSFMYIYFQCRKLYIQM